MSVINMPIHFENRKLVTPGDLLGEGDYVPGFNTYKKENKIYATRIGLTDYEGKQINVVALKAFYIPAVGDLVLGKVVDVGFTGWEVDILAPYFATLRASDTIGRSFNLMRDDLPSIFDVGDQILCEVAAYDRTRDPLLTVRKRGLGKIKEGQIIRIIPAKIPRIIGKKGSMISLIKKWTDCMITVSQNGQILIRGKSPEDEALAIKTIRKVEQEAHTNGLTDRITVMLQKERRVEENGKKEK
jgi:exosome complex component RRP4